MVSFWAGLTAVIGLGVIVAAMLNQFNLVPYHFTAWQGGPVAWRPCFSWDSCLGRVLSGATRARS